MPKKQAIGVLGVLANKNLVNNKVWESIFTDLQEYMKGKFLNILDVHQIVKLLTKVSLLDEKTCPMFVDYFVNKGYDHEDMAQSLGVARSVNLMYRVVEALSARKQTVTNVNFIVHMDQFIRTNMGQFNILQLHRLLTICK